MWKKEDANLEINSAYAQSTKKVEPKHMLKPFIILTKNNPKVTDFIEVAQKNVTLKWQDEYPLDNEYPAYRTIRIDQLENLLTKGLAPKAQFDNTITPWKHANFAERANKSSYISQGF